MQEVRLLMRNYSNAATDRDVVYRQFFEKMQRAFLKTLVCDDVIEEHKRQPLGQHSEPLERLLLYFRRAPQKDKYAVRRDHVAKVYRIVRLPGDRESAQRITEEEGGYSTPEEAYHEVFVRRVRELMDSVD